MYIYIHIHTYIYIYIHTYVNVYVQAYAPAGLRVCKFASCKWGPMGADAIGRL